MDETSLLELQIEVLKDRLIWAQQVLKKTNQVEPDLYEKLGVRFAQLIETQEESIKKLKGAIDDRTALKSHWKKFEDIKSESTHLFGEILAFHGGLVVRRSELDRRIYQIADGLCSYLSDNTPVKKAVTIPGPEDTYTGMTNIIRMHFPDFSIWGLPVIAHEFGHYLEVNERRNLFPDLFWDICEGQDLEDNIPILKEQFADLFATYALGPAYACMCILLEFDPSLANHAQEDHPTYAERVYFILEALRKMDEEDITRPNKIIIDKLEQIWSENLKLVDQEPITEDHNLDRRLQMMYEKINDRKLMLAGVRYNLGYHVNELTNILNNILAQKYLTKPEIKQQLSEMLRKYKDHIILPDVFNTAWLYRLENKRSNPNQISKVSLAMCHLILNQ